MKLTDMFPRKYASGEDLQGKAITLTIRGVQAERMRPQPGAPEELKYVVYFEKSQKGIILSRTLAGQIAETTGEDDTDNWTGKPVTLYPQPMTVAGKARTAIRARRPTNGQTEPPPTLNDEEEDF